MNIAIRHADLEEDRELLIDALFRYLSPYADGSRFTWLYRNNPHGQAKAWIASDMDNGRIVGMASAFPRRVYVDEREALGWVLGDFCIHDRYRSLGPALQLQRACLAGVDSGEVAFCYDFPSTTMLAIYKRLCIDTSTPMVRLAKPLRVDRKVAGLVNWPVLARGLSATGNLVLALNDWRLRTGSTVTISTDERKCGEEFSQLARHIKGRYGVCVQRSAEYLNWRYFANPLRRYAMLTARRDGVLLAYAIFCQHRTDAILVDLFGVDDPVVISSLVHRLLALLREGDIVTVSVPILASHPWVGPLQHLGFRARETSPVVIYALHPLPSSCGVFEGIDWFLMYGDRDS
jgi:hypothetical protein